MALEVNELGEATFSDEDVKAYLNRSTLAAVASASFVTQSQLDAFTSKEGGFVHDGSVFSNEVDSIKHALEYTFARTAIVHNGFENFQRGLNEETPIFFAHVASRGNGFAVIKTIIENGSCWNRRKICTVRRFYCWG